MISNLEKINAPPVARNGPMDQKTGVEGPLAVDGRSITILVEPI